MGIYLPPPPKFNTMTPLSICHCCHLVLQQVHTTSHWPPQKPYEKFHTCIYVLSNNSVCQSLIFFYCFVFLYLATTHCHSVAEVQTVKMKTELLCFIWQHIVLKMPLPYTQIGITVRSTKKIPNLSHHNSRHVPIIISISPLIHDPLL